MASLLFFGMNANAVPLTWSGCVSVIGTNNFLANSSIIVLATNPPIPNCNSNGIPGGVRYVVGLNGVTADNVKTLLSTALAAQLSNKKIMVYYDNTLPATLIQAPINGRLRILLAHDRQRAND